MGHRKILELFFIFPVTTDTQFEVSHFRVTRFVFETCRWFYTKRAGAIYVVNVGKFDGHAAVVIG